MPNSWDFEWLPKFKLRVFILLSELTYFFMMLLLNLSTPSLILPCFEGDPIIFENILPPMWRKKEIDRKIFGSRANMNLVYQYRTLLWLRDQKFVICFGFELWISTPLRRNLQGAGKNWKNLSFFQKILQKCSAYVLWFEVVTLWTS